ncbi:MAG: cell division protein FtsQ/DivIB [Rickettsiales bacterium]
MKKNIFLNIIFIVILIFIGFLILKDNFLNNFLVKNGFKLENFAIQNRKILSQKKIFEIAIQNIVDIENISIFDINLNKVYQNLINSNLFDFVIVKRIFPNTIQIYIEEKEPFAFLHKENDNSIYLIDKNGTEIDKFLNINNLRVKNLVHLFGINANIYIKKFIEKLEDFKKVNHIIYLQIQDKIIGLIYIENRRWDLIFENGLIVKMPEEITNQTLELLENFLIKNENNLIKSLDLRDKKKIYIQYNEN